MRKMESGWKAYSLSSQKYVLSLGFFIAEMSQETGHHIRHAPSPPRIFRASPWRGTWSVAGASVFFLQNRLNKGYSEDIPGYFAKLCKNGLTFSFISHTHIACGTAHLLATPEELCKPLRLLRLSQDPQCILVLETAIGGSNFHHNWFHHVPSKVSQKLMKNRCEIES